MTQFSKGLLNDDKQAELDSLSVDLVKLKAHLNQLQEKLGNEEPTEGEKAIIKANAEAEEEAANEHYTKLENHFILTMKICYLGLTLPWFVLLDASKAWIMTGLVSVFFVFGYVFLPEILRIVRSANGIPEPTDDNSTPH